MIIQIISKYSLYSIERIFGEVLNLPRDGIEQAERAPYIAKKHKVQVYGVHDNTYHQAWIHVWIVDAVHLCVCSYIILNIYFLLQVIELYMLLS